MNSAPVPTQMFNEEELWGRQPAIYLQRSRRDFRSHGWCRKRVAHADIARSARRAVLLCLRRGILRCYANPNIWRSDAPTGVKRKASLITAHEIFVFFFFRWPTRSFENGFIVWSKQRISSVLRYIFFFTFRKWCTIFLVSFNHKFLSIIHVSPSTRTNRNYSHGRVERFYFCESKDLAKFWTKSTDRSRLVFYVWRRVSRGSRDIKFANLKCKCHGRFRGVCIVAEFLLLRRELKPVVHGTRGLCKVKNKCNEAVASYSDSSLPDQARLTLKRNFFLRRPS